MPTSGKSLISAIIFDGHGGGSKVGWNEIKAWDSSQGVLWVHLDLNEKRTHSWLLKKSHLEKIQVLALTAEEVRPRTVFASNGVLIVLRGINHNPGAEPEDMVSIRIWLEESRIITTSLRKLTSIDDLIFSLQQNVGPKSPADFIVALYDYMNDHISESVEEIEIQIIQLESDILTAESQELRAKISEIRREAVMLRRYLSPQRDALYRLYSEPSYLFDDNHRQQLRLLGMNVGGLPGLGNPWGFYIACATMVTIGICTIIYFKNTKWL